MNKMIKSTVLSHFLQGFRLEIHQVKGNDDTPHRVEVAHLDVGLRFGGRRCSRAAADAATDACPYIQFVLIHGAVADQPNVLADEGIGEAARLHLVRAERRRAVGPDLGGNSQRFGVSWTKAVLCSSDHSSV